MLKTVCAVLHSVFLARCTVDICSVPSAQAKSFSYNLTQVTHGFDLERSFTGRWDEGMKSKRMRVMQLGDSAYKLSTVPLKVLERAT